MVIRTDRQIGLTGANTDQGDAQFVAQKAQQVEKLPAVNAVAGKNIMQFVDHQQAYATLRSSDSASGSISGSRGRGRKGAPRAVRSAT